MIRYPVSAAKLKEAIRAEKPNWLGEAERRTDNYVSLQRYEEPPAPNWSDVKPVFQDVQEDKCVFCERQFESRDFGTIEFDLEHFRPKSSVKAWPTPSSRLSYDFDTGGGAQTGYYWLAYKIGNYAASCKVCNSKLKSNYFPVAAPRLSAPGNLASEKAYLCYPIGTDDEDPEELIKFVATTAVPASADIFKKRRGQVIIDFFRLNEREGLHRGRAHMLTIIGNALDAIDDGRADEADLKWVEAVDGARLPHISCCRSFKRLWAQDPDLGKRIWKACKTYALTEKGAPVPDFT